MAAIGWLRRCRAWTPRNDGSHYSACPCPWRLPPQAARGPLEDTRFLPLSHIIIQTAPETLLCSVSEAVICGLTVYALLSRIIVLYIIKLCGI